MIIDRPVTERSTLDILQYGRDVDLEALVFGDARPRYQRELVGKVKPSLVIPEGQAQSRSILSEQVGGEIETPPFDPGVLAAAIEQNTRLFRCVHIMATNITGLGWTFVPLEQFTESTPIKLKNQFDKEKELGTRLLNRPNKLMTFNKLMRLVRMDQESTGNGYLEVTRTNDGDIAQLFHVPSQTMEILKDGAGFRQERGSDVRFFKNFGDEVVYSSSSFVSAEESSAEIPVDERATEIIHFAVPAPRSSFYGIPRWISSATAVTGNALAALRNVNFFENDATPRIAILVSGGRLGAESIKMIEEFVRKKGKGVENFGRAMVLQMEPKKPSLSDKSANVSVQIQPLTVGVTDDASFLEYRNRNDEEIRECFGIGREFFDATGINRASAVESRRITNDQVFEPERIEVEFVLNQTIFGEQGMNFKQACFKLKRPQATDPLDQARVFDVLSRVGAITPNEIRDVIDRPAFKDEFEFANKPINVALTEAQMGLAPLITNDGSQPSPQKDSRDKIRPEDFIELRRTMEELGTSVDLYYDGVPIPQ